MHLQLASKSPRRRELLDQIGVRYSVVDVDVPEVRADHECPEAYVARLAQDKAKAGLAQYPGTPTMGADTIVVSPGEHVLEKPLNEDDFYRMMRLLSGAEHSVITAVAIAREEENGIGYTYASATTKVMFREIGETEMRDYWLTGEPRDKAGGYAIQGRGAVFIERIAGSYSGVVGLPIEVLSRMLREFNIPVWNAK